MYVSYELRESDVEKVIHWISQETFWALGRSPEIIKKSFENSTPISIIDEEGLLLGIGRLITDGLTFGWLCDVFVDTAHRGKGVGHLIAQASIDYFEGIPRFRLILKTRDAHSVYADVGFELFQDSEKWMGIFKGY